MDRNPPNNKPTAIPNTTPGIPLETKPAPIQAGKNGMGAIPIKLNPRAAVNRDLFLNDKINEIMSQDVEFAVKS